MGGRNRPSAAPIGCMEAEFGAPEQDIQPGSLAEKSATFIDVRDRYRNRYCAWHPNRSADTGRQFAKNLPREMIGREDSNSDACIPNAALHQAGYTPTCLTQSRWNGLPVLRKRYCRSGSFFVSSSFGGKRRARRKIVRLTDRAQTTITAMVSTASPAAASAPLPADRPCSLPHPR